MPPRSEIFENNNTRSQNYRIRFREISSLTILFHVSFQKRHICYLVTIHKEESENLTYDGIKIKIFLNPFELKQLYKNYF